MEEWKSEPSIASETRYVLRFRAGEFYHGGTETRRSDRLRFLLRSKPPPCLGASSASLPQFSRVDEVFYAVRVAFYAAGG
jgi:hypothetical protein